MENRIKECQIDLFADRTSTAFLAANQLRLWFASLVYVLVEGTRRLALQATDLADATCGTIPGWISAICSITRAPILIGRSLIVANLQRTFERATTLRGRS
jgi:Transposase DDE domain group 1